MPNDLCASLLHHIEEFTHVELPRLCCAQNIVKIREFRVIERPRKGAPVMRMLDRYEVHRSNDAVGFERGEHLAQRRAVARVVIDLHTNRKPHARP